MRQNFQEYQKRGVQIVAVSMGNSQQMRDFKRMQGGYPFPLYGSPNREAYVSFGAIKSTPAQLLFQPNVLRRGLETTLKGHLPGVPVGDVSQLGADFLVDREGIVRWKYIANDVADNPSNVQVLNIIDKTAQLKVAK